jgi:hypothetical protein
MLDGQGGGRLISALKVMNCTLREDALDSCLLDLCLPSISFLWVARLSCVLKEPTTL